MRLLQRLRFPFLLLLLLLLVIVGVANSRHVHNDANELYRLQPVPDNRDSADSSSCAVGVRPTVMDALNELFTCLIETHIHKTSAHQLAGTIDFGHTAGSGITQPPLLPGVFTVNALAKESDSYRQFFNLVPAFTVELGKNETREAEQLARIESYLRHLESSGFIADTLATLKSNGAVDVAVGVSEFVRVILWNQWFKLYGRSSKSHAAGLRESSGFGHVMIGETRGNSVTGFHSWLQILAAEESGQFKYKGHFKVSREPLVTASIQFDWLGKSKSISSFWFGTPPDFELALLTASYVVNPGRKTRFAVMGKTIEVQTFKVNHQEESVGSAYPTL